VRRLIRKRRQQPEAALQRAVFEHIAYRKRPGWRFWSTPNAAKRSLQMGAELKAQGMTAGVGDISIVSPSGRYHELELKTPTGRLSPAQRERQEELKASGVICATAYGLDAALAILVGWGAIR
jgi:VRR-NUC domain